MASVSPVESYSGYSAARLHNGSESPVRPVEPKHVAFELLFPESPQYRARLPLRVQIFPHDSTESIVTTVKNFYGLYSGPNGSKGVSFEDDRGNTLIARYENFRNNMVVYVRVIEGSPPASGPYPASTYPPAPMATPAYSQGDYAPQSAHQAIGQHLSRPASRTSRIRSPSPNGGRGRRSTSVGTNPAAGKKGRSRSSKSRGPNYENHSDSLNGYSSGDNGSGSVTSKMKEQIGNTDISVENIVEGGRRKRAKFESSVSPCSSPNMDLHTNCMFANDSRCLRSFHCLRHHRCPLLPQIRPSRRPGELSINGLRCLSPTRGRTHSPTRGRCSPLKAMALGTITLALLQPRSRNPDATVEVLAILQFQASCPPQTPLSVVVCRKKTKTLLFSLCDLARCQISPMAGRRPRH